MMTGKTHDLAAFTALMLAVVLLPLPKISLASALVALGANMLGGLVPDIDESTSDFWDKFPLGSVLGQLVSPFLGAHRHLSHSFIGLFLIGYGFKYLLGLAGNFLLVDMTIVWWAFMAGLVSHLAMDMLTPEGVPLLFPLPWHLGFPPLKALRIKNGGKLEKFLVFPGLIAINLYLILFYYPGF